MTMVSVHFAADCHSLGHLRTKSSPLAASEFCSDHLGEFARRFHSMRESMDSDSSALSKVVDSSFRIRSSDTQAIPGAL